MLPERRHAEWLPGGKPPKRPVLTLVGMGGMCLGFLAMLSLPVLWPAGVDRFMPFILGLMAVGYLAMFAGIVGEFRRRNERVPLGESPSGVPQFPATAVLRREVAYGAEEGLLSFVDGWLVFSGRSLGFSVRRRDVELDMDDGGTSFTFAGPHGDHRATLMPLANKRAVQEAWAAWKRAEGEPVGIPLYPPVLPSPIRHTTSIWRFYVVFMGALGLLSFRVFPIVGGAELAVAAMVVYLDLSGRAALRHIANGEPPRRTGLRGAYWSLRQGESIQTVVHRALGRAERALR